MPEQTLTALEFPGVLGVVQQYAISALGRNFLARLQPVSDLSSIRAKFQEIHELQDLTSREGELPLADFPDLSSWLAKALVRGSLLPPEAFNDILQVLRLARQARHYLHREGDAYPRLQALAGPLHDLASLRTALKQCISPHNFILDQASPELQAVRRELSQTRESLNRQIKQNFFGSQYQDALQTTTISQRHGRYVIPLKADHKGAIPGIIHDQSQTRATLFLEPLAIVEQNNQLNLLGNREKREEEAVLRRLTDLVRNHLEEIKEILASLAEVDGLQAKVQFARHFKAREPIWRSQPGVDLRQARHPLLVQRCWENPRNPEVVPIDLELSPEQRFLIISGANAGGKTVALKTLGLLTLMVQSGIPIPVAEGSEFHPFDQVFADIGDPQDLHQDLSTFSAHLKRSLEMLEHLPERALVLLDELGTATDPTEGGALALALLQAFCKRGAYGAATTHIPLIKSFAQKQPGFANVAVIFDEETRKPTYRLAYGVVGASNALKIAREMGLSPEILEQAEGYLDQEELRAYRLLAEVEAARQQLAFDQEKLAVRAGELEREKEALAKEHQAFKEEQERWRQEAQAQAQERINRAEAEFKKIVKRLKEGQESWGRLRQEFSAQQAKLLQDLTPKARPAKTEIPEYGVGQKVFLPALGLSGRVLAAAGRDGRLEVQVRKVKLRVQPEEITPLTGGVEGPARGSVSRSRHLPPEWLPSLNVVGLRVDEALPLVDRLIDQAMLHGQEKVDIIHGVGTGRLKAAVWDHLKHHNAVKAMHGDDNPGVTVVELRE
ncbi:MAG: endonuclease MutS2 [Syntrophales bacterium]|nr:endonuclease MutS2 [Syntrophales bacterium]MDD5642512.1 endonuclease MutS2 [Syntrophales bacterium]